MDYRTYRVSTGQKKPLLDFVLGALRQCGCRTLHHSAPDTAPFRVTFEAPDGERMGIIVYAFYANRKVTKNRPPDEHRFQVKYSANTGELHELWQDPFDLYTTLFLGINPEEGFFVAADPVLHSSTRFFISVEFKDRQVEAIHKERWTAWERVKRGKQGLDDPVEILLGGTPESFLGYVRFERAAKGMDAGHRALLAEKINALGQISLSSGAGEGATIEQSGVDHRLAQEFELTQEEILDLIQSAPRLKMAVRGWIAETHLVRHLERIPGISECRRIEEDGKPDVSLSFRGSRPLLIECKNVLRKPYADGSPRLDFQRTRASKANPCSRYYSPQEFDLVAACLHPCTEHWEFCFTMTNSLDPHRKCPGRLSNLVRLDERWNENAVSVIEKALTPGS